MPANSGAKTLNPVIFPPGRLKLATKPVATGSTTAAITIGTVCVALRAALVAAVLSTRITSTRNWTSSAASFANPSITDQPMSLTAMPFTVTVRRPGSSIGSFRSLMLAACFIIFSRVRLSPLALSTATRVCASVCRPAQTILLRSSRCN